MYTKIGPFQDGGGPYLSAATLTAMDAGIAAANGGPAFVAAATAGVTTGGSDVSTALTSLLAGISTSTVVLLPTGTINLGSATINVDVSKVSLAGDRTTLTGTGTINLYSSATYSSNQTGWGEAVRGVIFSGLHLIIGHATFDTVGKFRLSDGGMIGGTLAFISNAWKIAFSLFHFQGTPISIAATASNAGENMHFEQCMITDGSNITLANTGDWHFVGCSIDNVTVDVTSAMVTFTGCHFENPGSTTPGYRMIVVHTGATVTVNGCQLVLNNPGVDWTEAPFTVDPAVINGGLFIRGLQVPLQTYYKPETGDKIRVLVAGGGTATFADIATYEGASAAAFALGETANLIRNGGSEDGSAAGWTTSGGGAYVLDTGFKNRGTSSHKIQASASTTEVFSQDVAVTPGRHLWFQCWQSFNPATGGSLNTQVNYYDRGGASISTVGFDTLTTATTRWKSLVDRVPAGAATARVLFTLTGGTAGVASMNVDDVIVNIA